MRILISNDDGIQAEGIQALHDELAQFAEVWVVAPDREQSATSHSITLQRPLRIKELRPRWYQVDGTPTDCVYVGLNHLMRDARPDVVCAGINHGPNVGNDVLYSGTVAAAMEAASLDVSSIAFSLAEGLDFRPAAKFAALLTSEVAQRPLPAGTLLNVNFPGHPTSAYAITHLGKRSYGSSVVEKVDPRGRLYYWIGGGEAKYEDILGSDCNAVFGDGLISITPLNLDMTDHPLLGTLRGWAVPGFELSQAKSYSCER
ncbi:MAG: 5'/3'-nucleotidase SurE [Myxococcales bacterium]